MIWRAGTRGFTRLVPGVFLLASIVIAGCSTATDDSLLERNKRLVRQMNHEVWNKGNVGIIDELYAPDFVLHFLPDGSEIRGLDGLRDHVREHRKAFPDWKEEIRRIVAEGDLVVIHYVSTGTNKGSWLGDPPSGKEVEVNEMSIFRIEDGRITDQWLLPDLFSFRQQLARQEDE